MAALSSWVCRLVARLRLLVVGDIECRGELVARWGPFWDDSCCVFAWRGLGFDRAAWTAEELPDDAFEKTEENIAEAQAWETAKNGVGGLHFLAIQDNPDAEVCAGLWLLLDRPLPKI